MEFQMGSQITMKFTGNEDYKFGFSVSGEMPGKQGLICYRARLNDWQGITVFVKVKN